MYVCMCIYLYVDVCVCVCVYVRMYVYVCMYVCACVIYMYICLYKHLSHLLNHKSIHLLVLVNGKNISCAKFLLFNTINEIF